jgi:hypothetical protein
MLLRECDLHRPEEALELLRQMYPSSEPPLKTRLFLEEVLGPTGS